ncbi:MAG: two-component system sensor histidine kinase/response regulator [Rhizobium sp.]|nr:two-component system sensor histidine kinase/response regulator [Rhizobium sp.]
MSIVEGGDDLPDDIGKRFLVGGGEMGALLRGRDWSDTPLGPPENWPQSLKTAIRIMLTSRQPIWIGWGEDLIYFYNDAYKSIIGGKHPVALGQPAKIVWQEIWDDIGPMLATAMTGIEGTYVEEQLLIMERNGYPEETYYTFSYSPIPDDNGDAGGIICANSDDTRRVIGERQLTLLSELATRSIGARTLQQACQVSVDALSTNAHDLPFVLLYLKGDEDNPATLEGLAGIGRDHPAAMPAVEGNGGWPIASTLAAHEIQVVAAGSLPFQRLPGGPWQIPPRQVALVPIGETRESGHGGVLVIGLNPYRLFDEGYRGFAGLIAGQIGTAIANAQAYEAERRRAEALAEIDKAKTTFFSNISHEFRTPLTLMLGPVEELISRQHGDDLPLLEILHRNGQRLLRLVNSLLDFSRIEAGRMQMRFEATDISSFTADLASTFRSAMEKAQLIFEVRTPSLSKFTYVDRDSWEKIILNLMSNAFKFTFDGSISVEVSESPDGNAAEITITDTGSGIPEVELPRLFERFHRIEGSKGRTIEGSGIGLALVQELVRLHGGTISVSSAVGRGSSFTICIPFGTAHLAGQTVIENAGQASGSARQQSFAEEALKWLPESAVQEGGAPNPSEKTGNSPRGERVLVVDDNADLRAYISGLLTADGYAIDTAEDGIDALEKIRACRPALILSDVMMPRLDGFGLLQQLRQDPELRDIPILLLSAKAGEEAQIEGLSAGADDYLTKPFSARELAVRVASNLQLARLRRETEQRLRQDAQTLQAEIAERKKAEEALQSFNETLEQRVRDAVSERNRLWDLSEDLLVIADYDGRLVRVSPSWERRLGYVQNELLSTPYFKISHPDEVEDVMAELAKSRLTGTPAHFDSRLKTVDGDWRWFAWTISHDPARDRLHGVGRDITADKAADEVMRHAEETLRSAQKMEAIGNLTGGVAHDFNNLLQVIGGNLQLLAKEVGGNDKAEQRVQNALAGVTRGSKLASQLLSFGRRQPLAPKIVNLGRFIRGLDDMLRRTLGEGIEIETIISGGLWNTLIDPFQVENALLNLAINSRDAMSGHGKLTIEAGNASLDDDYAARHADVQAGQYVMVAVTDTGSGMSLDVMEKVFEPFFTTKPEGQGTGLGLSMVYGFVKQSGGHIKIYSESGHGTTIRLYLPRVRQDEDRVSETETGPITGGSETVLVVEDDEDVRATVVDLLSDLGYKVLKARDAASGLAIIESGMMIDLLFTDVVMPGPLRSPELARRARERLPNIAVLFTSGYTDNAIVHAGRLDQGIELLSKPYRRESLARKLRHLLGNQQQRNSHPINRASPVSEQETEMTSISAPLKILLVEDDGLIRMNTAEMLGEFGHEVYEAGSSREALDILDRSHVDVLLTDINLPDMSGVELSQEAIRRRPEIHIVYASGEIPDLSVTPGSAYLLKPYSDADLKKVVEKPQAENKGA